MDSTAIDPLRYEAGARYLKALKDLGLMPDALFWAIDREREEAILVLVSRYLDAVGPLSMQEVLFKAYNAAATPAEIDPFIVALRSPKQAMIRKLADILEKGVTISNIASPEAPGTLKFPDASPEYELQLRIGPMELSVKNIYVFKMPGNSMPDLAGRWNVISRKVDQLAA